MKSYYLPPGEKGIHAFPGHPDLFWKGKEHRLESFCSLSYNQDTQSLWMKLKEQDTWVWTSFRDGGTLSRQKLPLAVFSRQPLACTRIILFSKQIQWRTATSCLTVLNEDDLGLPCAVLKQEAGKIIGCWFESSFLPNPAQDPERLLVHYDDIS